MDETRYGLRVSLDVPYADAVARTADALKAQGFGVLTTIDVQQTLKAKLDRDFRKYVILGACNPPLADRALRAELEGWSSASLQRRGVRNGTVFLHKSPRGPACGTRDRRR